MKYAFWIIGQIIVLAWVLLIAMNAGNTTPLTLINETLANLLNIQPIYLNIQTLYLLLILFVAGESSIFFFFYPVVKQKIEKEGAFERRLEKTSVSNDESNAKVKVLEAKIQVLEKALKDALNQN